MFIVIIHTYSVFVVSPAILLSHIYRVCEIRSVDGSNITTYCVHECEAANRIGMRSRRFIFTGHTNGVIQVSFHSTSFGIVLPTIFPQIWDLTTALELSRQRPGIYILVLSRVCSKSCVFRALLGLVGSPISITVITSLNN